HAKNKKKKKKGGKQLAQWALLIGKPPLRKAFLVFKGTDANKVLDVIVDGGVVPLPLFFKDCNGSDDSNKAQEEDAVEEGKEMLQPDPSTALIHDMFDLKGEKDDPNSDNNDNNNNDNNNNNNNNAKDCDEAVAIMGHKNIYKDALSSSSTNLFQLPVSNSLKFNGFSVHSGMYASIIRDFRIIQQLLLQYKSFIDQLVITGHSGGLATLFGLQSIMSGIESPPIQVITYGAPMVIAIEHEWESLSPSAKYCLRQLKRVCHHIVNQLDPIPRIPFCKSWVRGVVPYLLKNVVSDHAQQTLSLPDFVSPLLKLSVRTGARKLMKYVEMHKDLLHCYSPIGTYYVYNATDNNSYYNNYKKLYCFSRYDNIHKILSFHPPIKFMEIHYGQEIRVQLKETDWRCQECLIKPLTSPPFGYDIVNGVVTTNLSRIESLSEKEKEKLIKAEKTRKQMTELFYFTEPDREWCDQYICVLDEDMEACGYNILKFPPKSWTAVLNCHLISNYLLLFQPNAEDALKHRQSVHKLSSKNTNTNNGSPHPQHQYSIADEYKLKTKKVFDKKMEEMKTNVEEFKQHSKGFINAFKARAFPSQQSRPHSISKNNSENT
ncbi:hypothetical protein RFI_11915, partial [Reticulomyxa filosa]